LDTVSFARRNVRGWKRLRLNEAVNYVAARQNRDGGYTFCQGAESNAQDTYYGLAILNLLHASFPNVEKRLVGFVTLSQTTFTCATTL